MARKKPSFRKHLSKPGLLQEVRDCFEAISDDVRGRKYSLADYLMSGLALFSLKFPSLLQFDGQVRSDDAIRANLLSLFGVGEAPSDSGLRKRLDRLDPDVLRKAFQRVFSQLQRGKGLEGYAYWEGHYLLSIDGTGTFSSRSVHCAKCCEKHRRDGSTEYYHQMLAAVVVHPEHRGGVPACAGADPEVGWVQQERLRAQRGATSDCGCAPGASASAVDRSGGWPRVERAAYQTVAAARDAFHPGCEARGSRSAVQGTGEQPADAGSGDDGPGRHVPRVPISRRSGA